METQTPKNIATLINDYVELKAAVKKFTQIIEIQAKGSTVGKPIFEVITESELFLEMKELSK